jgi:hypothetical protein
MKQNIAKELLEILIRLNAVINLDDDGDYFICKEAEQVIFDMENAVRKYTI